MSAQHSRRANTAADGRGQRSNDAKGAEAYPYDATLQLESQCGLDRLRFVADRALAADFFAIFQAAERNSAAALAAEGEQAYRDETELKRLCALAARTLAGKLGADEKQSATHLLLDKRGQCAAEPPLASRIQARTDSVEARAMTAHHRRHMH